MKKFADKLALFAVMVMFATNVMAYSIERQWYNEVGHSKVEGRCNDGTYFNGSQIQEYGNWSIKAHYWGHNTSLSTAIRQACGE